MKLKKILLLVILSFLLVSCWTEENKVEVKKDIESPFFWDKNSDVQMKIYTDFQCPACIWFEWEVWKYILEEFAQKNKIGLTYKMFPLNFHKNAERDALWALCSLKQWKYKEFATEIYSLEKKLNWGKNTDEARLEIAKKIWLDEFKFTTCMKENHYLSKIKSDIQEWVDDKVTGTPSIYFNWKSLPLGWLTKESISTLINKTLNK